MPIIPTPVPKGAGDTLVIEMRQRTSRSAFMTTNMSRFQGSRLGFSTPHTVEYLPFESIVRRLPLRAGVVNGGVRYLMHGPDNTVIAAARLLPADDQPAVVAAGALPTINADTPYRLADFTEGPYIEGTVRAIREAEASEPVRKTEFTISLLEVPSIKVVALWLRAMNRNEDESHDIVIPLPPTHSSLSPFAQMTVKSFLAELFVIAEHLRHPDFTRDAPQSLHGEASGRPAPRRPDPTDRRG